MIELQSSTHSLHIYTSGGPAIRRSTCSALRLQKLQSSVAFPPPELEEPLDPLGRRAIFQNLSLHYL